MRTLIKTKLIDPNHVEVREYELGQDLKIINCLQRDYKHCTHLEENYMILTLAKQEKGKVLNTQMSKFPPYGYYRIYKFLWKPIGKIKSTQLAGKTIKFVGNKAIIS